MTVTEETEAEVRRLREEAEEQGRRILNGEQAWEDQEADVNDFVEGENPPTVEEPKNDDVGETGEEGDEVVEVDQDNPAPEPTE